MSGAAIPEPKPQQNGGAEILEVLITAARERAKLGLENYGVPLQSDNGRNALEDARQESIDMSMYLCQAIIDYDTLLAALKIAADALDIAADWGITDMQVNPPLEWRLESYEELESEGWCSTSELARKLRQLALVRD